MWIVHDDGPQNIVENAGNGFCKNFLDSGFVGNILPANSSKGCTVGSAVIEVWRRVACEIME